MKKLGFTLLFFSLAIQLFSQETSEEKINNLVDQWHKAAAEADFDQYFGLMTADGVFIGTDATENWQNDDFREFSKPYFDRGKAWSFTSLERNIYFNENKSIAWFDELLDTHMGICRGSGVLQKTETGWKIAHYVLSIAIPNENVEEVTQLKKSFDKKLISEIRNN
ncbi:MAG: nuclear transport factor 2 family protein [Salegentibacter sp.]|uniref:SnoaL-like domain-containing protein n=1 Tax=Salegentibacter flavus TaxID=287099 RepID=A0A1I4ZQU4_9FLAO|nr:MULTISPECIES: nuclear transport factor 2 family protein [Salegentibacter]MDR9458386.1 nuclear transport factor 2 family protein [Salegentibacter sp.]SFN52644.1 SnoaL-like domain-containing protein [Salegentibacter flavus]